MLPFYGRNEVMVAFFCTVVRTTIFPRLSKWSACSSDNKVLESRDVVQHLGSTYWLRGRIGVVVPR